MNVHENVHSQIGPTTRQVRAITPRDFSAEGSATAPAATEPSQIGRMLVDSAGCISMVDALAARWLGVPPMELIGRLVPPASMQEIRQGRKSLRVPAENGMVHWIQFIAALPDSVAGSTEIALVPVSRCFRSVATPPIPFSLSEILQLAASTRRTLDAHVYLHGESIGFVRTVIGTPMLALDAQGGGFEAFGRLIGTPGTSIVCADLTEASHMQVRNLHGDTQSMILEAHRLLDEKAAHAA